MSSKRFLITGATGATGGKTVELLLERGYQVRAFVHQYDERSAQLEKLESISLEAYHEQLVKRRGPFGAQHIVEVAKDHAAGIFSGTDEVIEHITGQPPMDLEAYIRKHREAFE